MLGGDCNLLEELPPFLMASENYYRKAGAKNSQRGEGTFLGAQGTQNGTDDNNKNNSIVE